MASVLKAFLLAVFLLAAASAARAGDDRMGDRFLGKADAPIKVEEFVSLTCTHCAGFYTETLPELEKKYVDTGKVRFIMREFALNGIDLKAFAVARCMPADEYFPFVKTLYAAQANWAFGGGDPEKNLIQYAKLGGLPEEKAKACIADTKLQDEIIAERTAGGDKYKVEATPTFVINDGAETIAGAQPLAVFEATFDRLLAAKK